MLVTGRFVGGLRDIPAIVEAFEGFIYVCAPDNRIEFANRQAIDFAGRDLIGQLAERYRVYREQTGILLPRFDRRHGPAQC